MADSSRHCANREQVSADCKEGVSPLLPQLVCRLDHQEVPDCIVYCRHWEYELKDLNILSVDASDDGSPTVILAAIQV
jgi:hypothetical protein